MTNVTAAQIANTGQVRIQYNVSDADGDLVTARVICSSNNGTTFDMLPVTVSGDVNHSMAVGTNKVILWDAARDFPGRHWSQVVAKVYASDGPAVSGEMVAVPAGVPPLPFIMGHNGGADYSPQHNVYLDDFLIDKYEVSNAEFKQFIDAGGYSTQALWTTAGWAWRLGQPNDLKPQYWDSFGDGYPGYPVVGVSFFEAEAYANFVGKRLPTEAEWEKAARGANGRTYPWGETLDESRGSFYGSLSPYANQYLPVGFFDGSLHTNPTFQTTASPSPYGAYDMFGSVWEWTHDWYQPDYYQSSPSSNPQGPLTGSYRVIRGGSYRSFAQPSYFRANEVGAPYYVTSSVPQTRDYTLGFRCVR